MAVKTPVETRLPNGPAAAAVLAGGIGAAVLGIDTVLAESSTAVSNILNWTNPVGSLSGKVGVAVILYLLSWLGLGLAWRGKNVNFKQIATITFVLLAIGILGTFPPVFDLIAGK